MATSASSVRKSNHSRLRRHRGFSLVEVTLSLGIISFAFVGIFTLIPTGLHTFRQATDASIGSQIAQRVIGDALQTDYDVLTDEANLPNSPSETPANYTFRAPAVHAPAFRYFDDQGVELVRATPAEPPTDDEKRRIVYWVNTRIQPRTERVQTGSEACLQHLATITVQVATNPANRTLNVTTDDDPASGLGKDLLKPTPGVAISTYTTFVARNR
jgi:uncharacterized protein (TIGR02598 family)